MILLLFLTAAPVFLNAQTSKTKPPKSRSANASSLKLETVEVFKGNANPPKWALAQGYLNDRPVYFPDYYIFYTPQRGYIYWKDGAWTSGPQVPDFISEAELKRARTQILENEDNNEPEKQIDVYLEQFPAQPLDHPVPLPGRN